MSPLDVCSSKPIPNCESAVSEAFSRPSMTMDLNCQMSSTVSSMTLTLHSSSSSSDPGPNAQIVKTIPRHDDNTFCRYELDDRLCQHCYQRGTLFEDWKNGDRVCTSCGVVDEEHLMDESPEWREYDNDDKGSAAVANLARCGLVLTDELKYWGGLQPTTLSKYLFNGPSASAAKSNNNVRKRLYAAKSKVDWRIEKIQKNQMQAARLSHEISKKRRRNEETNGDDDEEDDDAVREARPEYEQLVIQTDEEALRIHMALYADKWSLDRALKLYEHREVGPSTLSYNEENDDDRDSGRQKLDHTLQKASLDLYNAYSMLRKAAQKLNLSTPVVNDATAWLCRYAQYRDGIRVRGVASNDDDSSLTEKESDPNGPVYVRPNRQYYGNAAKLPKHQILQQQQARRQKRRFSHTNVSCNNTSIGPVEMDEVGFTKRDRRKWKQIGALCSALLFYSSRNLKYPRLLQEVCDCIEPPTAPETNDSEAPKSRKFIERKHFSKAMHELKECFPEYVQSSSLTDDVAVNITPNDPLPNNSSANVLKDKKVNDMESTTNFVEHQLRKLCLPPVAEAAIQCLVCYWGNRKSPAAGVEILGGAKMSTICAAVTYFVCLTGSAMQNMASQAVAAEKNQKSSASSWKDMLSITSRRPGKPKPVVTTSSSFTNVFDVFEHDSKIATCEQRRYEMRRMWDAWIEQMQWTRTSNSIEKSSGVSQKLVHDYYKKFLHPHRQKLLSFLSESVKIGNDEQHRHQQHRYPEQILLGETPLASVLLSHVTIIETLLKTDCKV